MSVTLTNETRAFLEEKRFAVLATINDDGSPQQSAIWYELQGNEILMNTRRGRVKDRNLRRNRRVSFCVVEGYQYVAIRGEITLNDDQRIAQEDIKRLAVRYNGRVQGEQQAREQYSKEERVTIRLSIDSVTLYGFD